jgi:hypothetical protein
LANTDLELPAGTNILALVSSHGTVNPGGPIMQPLETSGNANSARQIQDINMTRILLRALLCGTKGINNGLQDTTYCQRLLTLEEFY